MADWWDQNGYTQFQPPEQTTTPGAGPGPYGSPTGGYTGGMFPSNPSLSGLGGNGTRPIQGMDAGGPQRQTSDPNAPGYDPGATTRPGSPIGSGGWTPENPTWDPTKPLPYQQPGGAAPGAPPPSAGGQGSGPPPINRNDPASVDAYIAYYAQQPGANPSLARDPGYWKQKIMSGELGDDPGYYVSKFMTPEGPPAGGGGGGTYGNYPLGGSVAPGAGGTGWTQPFQGLTLDQLRNTPGYQFAQEQGQKAITGSAAARGTLLTGGTMKSLARCGTGLADQTFGDAYGRTRNEYLDAYGIDRNNRSDIFNRYFNLSSYGTQNPGA